MSKGKEEARYSIHVIRLKPEVLQKRKFREANPQHDPAKPCVYVGMTARSPEQRFAQHKAGIKCGRGFVRDFWVCLMPRQYASCNPMTYKKAKWMEVEKARRLRNRGYAVWQK